MNIGVFAADPGGTTGLAWGVFDPLLPDIGDQLRGRLLAGSVSVTGDAREQIREISDVWSSFFTSMVHDACLPHDRIWFVCEKFIYSGRNTYSGESASISTALIWGVEGYRMGRRDEWLSHRRRGQVIVSMPPMVMQSAGDAKGFATNVRLKEWDCWVKGDDHQRSAWQHIAFFLKRYQALGLK